MSSILWLRISLLLCAFSIIACQSSTLPGTFGNDVAHLRAHVKTYVLGEDQGAQIAVVPAYQGRVMTSTCAGDRGESLGWINREAIASGVIQPHINVYGGEDRFWMGPEGGQHSIFFQPDDPFDLDHWQTPACIDTEPWHVIERDSQRIRFKHQATLINYSGTSFDLTIDRQINLLSAQTYLELAEASKALPCVAYETINTLTNRGAEPWIKSSGLPSIWILGMFKPSPSTVVIIPFESGSESDLGPIVNDAYFGKVPEDRLRIDEGVIYFRGDGQYRSKIGLGPLRVKDCAGSYDSSRGLLTLIQYSRPDTPSPYVNSMWEIQSQPYAGDVINSYNDGPPEPGAKPLGPFYELESSSPAAALSPGESLTHVHRTIHVMGDQASLDPIARHFLNVSLADVAKAF